jgi:hypothetical protein
VSAGKADSQTEHPDILMQSTVSTTGRPSVQLKWGDMTGQLTPEEARDHALHVLECAEAAIHDAAFLRWAVEKSESPLEAAYQVLFELRRFRGDSTREDWRGGEAEANSPR